MPESQRPTTNYQVVSPTYFSTLDLPIVAGRAFDSRDTRDSPRVCIVNEAFVRTLGGRSPIGMRVSFTAAGSPQDKPNAGEIVGVAKQVKGRPDERRTSCRSTCQWPTISIDDILLMVRSKTGRADALTPAVRAAISRIDKEQLVSVRDVVTLEDVEWAATGRHRFRAVMVTAFATLAVALAMVGVFGILAYSVQQRVRDFGCAARSARPPASAALVVSSALRVVTAGAVIGLILAAVVRPVDRLDVVRRAAAGLRHVRGSDDAGGDDRGGVDRRPGLAADADRSRGGAAEHVASSAPRCQIWKGSGPCAACGSSTAANPRMEFFSGGELRTRDRCGCWTSPRPFPRPPMRCHWRR